MRDAASFGEHVNPPLVFGRDLIHRTVVLAVVALITGMLVAVLATPGLAVIGRTVKALATKFDVDAGVAEVPQIAQRSVVVDRNGKLLSTLAGEENRIVVPLGRIRPMTQNAVIAVEDASFYSHHGVDLAGLIRATLLNFRSGSVRQGGSTITQQLVKNTIVGTERSLDRKIREAKLAVELEKNLRKDEILELYLNETYFGEGVYGIATAAEFYFGKKISKINLAESALLAGIIRAPENYSPLDEPDAARQRRAFALGRMLDEGFITREQHDRANAAPMRVKAHELPAAVSPYFTEYVKAQILDDKDDEFAPQLGETRQERAQALFQAGLRIETTLDRGLQGAARRATAAVLDRRDDPASALVSIDAATGGVVAMVGGRDFEELKFNLAVQGARQPGSTFKPFTMLAALAEGFAPTYTLNTPSPLKVYDPGQEKNIKVSNYDGRPRGLITMREATWLSVNTYYMQLIQKIGPTKVVEMAEKAGITSDLKPVLSLALGTEVVSPFELTSAYSTLANNGVRCEPYAITRIEAANGDTLYRNEPDCARTISAGIASQATDILAGVITDGTGATNGQIGRPAAGKTGTTDEYTDSWFAGYTPQFSTVVWLGFPESNERSLYNIHGLPQVFGGSLPAMIWNRYMREAHDGLPVLDFPDPPDVEGVRLPSVLGMTFDEAKPLLEGKGFVVRRASVASDAPEGTVVEQTPPGDRKVQPGIAITLGVSDGSVEPEPTKSPTPKPSPKPSPTPTPDAACEDGEDNDDDGVTDHPDDPGCENPNDDDETDP